MFWLMFCHNFLQCGAPTEDGWVLEDVHE
jgi:hypothetical protein